MPAVPSIRASGCILPTLWTYYACLATAPACTRTPPMRRLIIGITGATGAIFGVRLLEVLQDTDIETHLVASRWAQQTIEHETAFSFKEVRAMAKFCHEPNNMGASISSV